MSAFRVKLRNLSSSQEFDQIVVEADVEADAEAVAARKGWVVTTVEPIESQAPANFWEWFTADFGSGGTGKKMVSGKPLAMMCRAMGAMLKGSMSIEQALMYYTRGLKDRALAATLDQVRRRIEAEGLKPAEAFEASNRFDNQFLAVMKASDESSALGTGLRKIADERSKIEKMKGTLKNDLFMPVLSVLILSVAFIYFQFGYVQIIEETIRDMRIDPGVFMGTVFGIGGFVRTFWILIVGGVVVTAVLIGTQKVFRKRLLGFAMSRSKTVRIMVRGLQQLSILSTMDLILNCYGENRGMGMENALTAASEVSVDNQFHDDLVTARRIWVTDGESMEEAMNATSLDDEIKHLISVGESSSSYGIQVANLVDMYEETTNDAIAGFLRFADVAAKIVVAVLIFFLASAVVFPLIILGPKMINPAG